MVLERLGAALAGLLLALVAYGLVGCGLYVVVEVIQAWLAA